MNAEQLLTHFDRLADAPDAIPRLRRFILDLAVRGKLVEQDPEDEPASELLKRIAVEKRRMVEAGEIKKAKPRLPISDDAPFNLPVGWAWSTIGEICSKTGSGSTPRGGKNTYREEGIVFLRSQNVYDDGLRLHDVAYIDTVTHAKMSGTVVRPGDLLLNITGGSMGRCCRVPDDFDEANVSQHVAIIRIAVHGLQDFVHRLILSPYFQSFIFGEQTGAGRGGLPKNKMDLIPFPLPPLAEQHRIVAKVDELMALCDRLETERKEREATRDRLTAASLARLNAPDPDPAVFQNHAAFALDNLASLTTRPDQIKALRQTILNLAVRGKLVEQDPEDEPAGEQHSSKPEREGLPANWRRLRLEEFLTENTRNGYSRKPDDAPDGIPILRISAGTTRIDGLVAEEKHKLISGIGPDIREKYRLMDGDLLACRFNGNKDFVGRMKLFRDYLGIQPIYPDKLIRVRVDPFETLPEFVRIAGESDLIRQEVEAFCSTTVGNWGISASKLKKVVFPLPPLAEQHRIVAKVDELMAVCDRLEAGLAAGEETRGRLVEALLYETVSAGVTQNDVVG